MQFCVDDFLEVLKNGRVKTEILSIISMDFHLTSLDQIEIEKKIINFAEGERSGNPPITYKQTKIEVYNINRRNDEEK